MQKTHLALCVGLVLGVTAAAQAQRPAKSHAINFTKVTPVLLADRIEPVLGFWGALGFGRAVEVPEGDHLGFVILTRDEVEVMYETRSLAGADLPALQGEVARYTGIVYIEVQDLDAVIAAVGSAPVVKPRHVTNYGTHEIYVRDPAGNVIGFAQHEVEGGD